MAVKRDRSAFLYMEPHPNNPDFAQCGDCMHFIPGAQRCIWFGKDDEVKAEDSCGFFAQGDPSDDQTPRGLFTKEELGYYSSGPVRCENCDGFDARDKSRMHCDVYVQLNRMFPKIWNLDEKVKPKGCCNAFGAGKRDPKNFGPYGPIPDADDAGAGGPITKLIKA